MRFRSFASYCLEVASPPLLRVLVYEEQIVLSNGLNIGHMIRVLRQHQFLQLM
jgi:hypothetical protein